MRYRSVLTLLFGLCTAPALWAAPAQKTFSDWQVTCNNQNFCVARNIGEHAGRVMSLERSAGARADAALRIDLGGIGIPAGKAPPIAGRLLLDGQPLKMANTEWKIAPWHLMTSNPQTVAALLETIQEGQTITLQSGQGRISLAGLKAALLFIDAQQKRVGSKTAWIKKGVSPPLSVPPAPALKEVVHPTAAPAPLTHQQLNDLLDYGNWRMSNTQCSLDPARRQVRVYALTNDKALLMIDCEAGAYNVVDLAWLVSRQKPFISRLVRLRLPFSPDNGNSEMELMNASFNEKSRELTTLAKGRGLADCGVASRWRFDGQNFRLVRYAQEPTCDSWHGPDSWPTLWVTR